ncbi:MAG: NAD-dependent epimerase/dehydratase family protein [Tepidisphaerales bacterium]
MPTDWRSLHGTAFAGRRVLITGGAGFIGSHLADALLALGADVTILDDLSHGDRGHVPAGARFIHASVLDADRLADAIAGRELVFHQAALGSVPRSVEQPALYSRVNIDGTLAVLDAARRDGGVRLVAFAASSSAYGDTDELPKHEGMPPRPLSPYAATKVAGEALMHAYAACYGLDTVSLRYFNIFGPRQNANSAYAAVIAAFASRLLAGQRPVIFGDGSQSRDFTHVDNAVHANLLAARQPRPLAGRVLNVATGHRVTVAELARTMSALLGRPDLTPEHRPPRVGDVLHSQASIDAAAAVLGYRPIVSLERGLEETLAWYRSAGGAQATPG